MPNRKRNKAINLRMTEEEYVFFQDQYEKSEMKNQTDFFLAVLRDGAMKDLANTMGAERGFSVVDFRKPSMDRTQSAERHIQLKGVTSWKEELREVIAEAKKQCRGFMEFRNYLEQYGVTIERNTEKTISFKHPEKEKAIRGDRLGAEYTRGAILSGFSEQRNRAAGDGERSIERARGTKQDGVREHVAEGRIGGIQREIRDVDAGVRALTGTGRRVDEERQRLAQGEDLGMDEREQTEHSGIEGPDIQLESSQRTAQRKHKGITRGYDLQL